MKAWNDLKSDPDQVFYTTMGSEYWIDMGVKIERFNTGKIVIKNALRPGDFMYDLTQGQLNYFVFYGWREGMFKVNVDEFERKLYNADKRIERLEIKDPKNEMYLATKNRAEIIEILIDRREKLEKSLQKR